MLIFIMVEKLIGSQIVQYVVINQLLKLMKIYGFAQNAFPHLIKFLAVNGVTNFTLAKMKIHMSLVVVSVKALLEDIWMIEELTSLHLQYEAKLILHLLVSYNLETQDTPATTVPRFPGAAQSRLHRWSRGWPLCVRE